MQETRTGRRLLLGGSARGGLAARGPVGGWRNEEKGIPRWIERRWIQGRGSVVAGWLDEENEGLGRREFGSGGNPEEEEGWLTGGGGDWIGGGSLEIRFWSDLERGGLFIGKKE